MKKNKTMSIYSGIGTKNIYLIFFRNFERKMPIFFLDNINLNLGKLLRCIKKYPLPIKRGAIQRSAENPSSEHCAVENRFGGGGVDTTFPYPRQGSRSNISPIVAAHLRASRAFGPRERG